MTFVEDPELTEQGIPYEEQRRCYLETFSRLHMVLSMPQPVQPNAPVNGNQNAHPNGNPNAHQIPQTAVNTIVQPTVQIANQHPHQVVTNDDGNRSAVNNNATVKQKKAVNGWVAFRSYNQKSAMFAGSRQGFRSKLLSCVWAIEPFQAKFDIMGKAFTRIRDTCGVDHLRDFIDICAPLMRTLKVDDYFENGGLKYATDAENEVFLIGELTIPNKDSYNTNISTNELIRACHERGFFEGELSSVVLPGDQFEQGVAGASNQLHSFEVGSQRSGRKKHSNNDSGAVAVFRYPEGYLEAQAAREILHPSQFFPGGYPAQQNALLSKSSAYTLGSIKYQGRLMNDSYPYYASFDPDQNIAYVYRPWIGDASDAFEIGGGFSDAHAYRP